VSRRARSPAPGPRGPSIHVDLRQVSLERVQPVTGGPRSRAVRTLVTSLRTPPGRHAPRGPHRPCAPRCRCRGGRRPCELGWRCFPKPVRHLATDRPRETAAVRAAGGRFADGRLLCGLLLLLGHPDHGPQLAEDSSRSFSVASYTLFSCLTEQGAPPSSSGGPRERRAWLHGAPGVTISLVRSRASCSRRARSSRARCTPGSAAGRARANDAQVAGPFVGCAEIVRGEYRQGVPAGPVHFVQCPDTQPVVLLQLRKAAAGDRLVCSISAMDVSALAEPPRWSASSSSRLDLAIDPFQLGQDRALPPVARWSFNFLSCSSRLMRCSSCFFSSVSPARRGLPRRENQREEDGMAMSVRRVMDGWQLSSLPQRTQNTRGVPFLNRSRDIYVTTEEHR